jgi:DNA-binding response OmpR family regulator
MVSSKRIIVIDDEVDMCWVLERLLQHKGYQVRTAVTGELGVTLLEKYDADLAIIDCKLPDTDGFDIAATALQLRPTISLILISGFPFAEESELRRRVRKLNAHFLAKPFEVSELCLFIDQLMITENPN